MFQISPTLTVDNAKAVLQDGLQAIAAGEREFDLAPMATADSAAVATLLAWQRAARARGTALIFKNLPTVLQSLVRLYGVAQLLGVAENTVAAAEPSHP
jgi:phospholipid transport system transporter-binding protein